MKSMIQFLIVSLFLTGCMDTAIRFWNNTGWEPSAEEQQLFRECSVEVKKEMRESPDGNPGDPEVQKWLSEYLDRIVECEKRRKAKSI